MAIAGTQTLRAKPLPDLPSPRLEVKSPKKTLPNPELYQERKKQSSEKPSDRNSLRPDIDIPIAPASPREKDDSSISRVKGTDQGREKPSNQS